MNAMERESKVALANSLILFQINATYTG